MLTLKNKTDIVESQEREKKLGENVESLTFIFIRFYYSRRILGDVSINNELSSSTYM